MGLKEGPEVYKSSNWNSGTAFPSTAAREAPLTLCRKTENYCLRNWTQEILDLGGYGGGRERCPNKNKNLTLKNKNLVPTQKAGPSKQAWAFATEDWWTPLWKNWSTLEKASEDAESWWSAKKQASYNFPDQNLPVNFFHPNICFPVLFFTYSMLKNCSLSWKMAIKTNLWGKRFKKGKSFREQSR